VPVRCCTTVHVYDAVVIGASQAGLSASYHLRLISGSTRCPRRGAYGHTLAHPRPPRSAVLRRPRAVPQDGRHATGKTLPPARFADTLNPAMSRALRG
jgi:hypothetical protein